MPKDKESIVFEPVFAPQEQPQDTKIVQEKDAEIQRLMRELSNLRQTLSDAQARNLELNRENSALRQENTSLHNANVTSESKLKQLIAMAKKARPGIGGRGVNKLKDTAEKIDTGFFSGY